MARARDSGAWVNEEEVGAVGVEVGVFVVRGRTVEVLNDNDDDNDAATDVGGGSLSFFSSSSSSA